MRDKEGGSEGRWKNKRGGRRREGAREGGILLRCLPLDALSSSPRITPFSSVALIHPD
jgi:hypothetical protein